MLAEVAASGVRPNAVTLNTALKFLVHTAPAPSPGPEGPSAAAPLRPAALEAAAALVAEMEGRGVAADTVTLNTLLHLHVVHGDIAAAPAGPGRPASGGRGGVPSPA